MRLQSGVATKCNLANSTKVSRKISRYTTPLTFLSRSTRCDLGPLWNAPRYKQNPVQLEPWQYCWKRSPTVEELSCRHRQRTAENVTHLPIWRGTKQPQSSSSTSMPSLGGSGDDWQSSGTLEAVFTNLSERVCGHGGMWPFEELLLTSLVPPWRIPPRASAQISCLVITTV